MNNAGSFQDVIGGAQQMGANAAESITGAAQAMQNFQTSQTKQQELEQQLNDTKFDSVIKRTQNQMAIQDPVIQKQVAAMNDKAMQGTVYPDFFKNLHKSDDAQAGTSAALDFLASNPLDPAAKKQALAAFMDPTATHQMLAGFTNRQQQEALAAVTNMKLQNAKDVQGMKNEQSDVNNQRTNTTGLQKAQLMGGIRLDGREASAVKDVTNDSEVVPLQKSIQQAKKDYDLIQQSRTEGLTPLKANELVQSYVSLLKGQAASSVGAERESLEHSATDMETRGNQWLQKIQGQGQVKYADEPFLHDMEENVRGLHGTIKDSLQQRLNEKLRDSGLPSVNNAQHAAYNTIMQGADLGYKPMGRGSSGASVPAQAPAAAPQAQLSQTQQAALAEMVAAGIDPAKARAKVMGGK